MLTLLSILSHLSGFVHSSPAYRFLFISRYGKYTWGSRCHIGVCVGGGADRLIDVTRLRVLKGLSKEP